MGEGDLYFLYSWEHYLYFPPTPLELMYKRLPIPWCIVIYSCRKCCSWAVGGGRSVKLAVIWMRRDAALHHSLACYSHSRVSSLREMRGKGTHLLTILITLPKEGGEIRRGFKCKIKSSAASQILQRKPAWREWRAVALVWACGPAHTFDLQSENPYWMPYPHLSRLSNEGHFKS